MEKTYVKYAAKPIFNIINCTIKRILITELILLIKQKENFNRISHNVMLCSLVRVGGSVPGCVCRHEDHANSSGMYSITTQVESGPRARGRGGDVSQVRDRASAAMI